MAEKTSVMFDINAILNAVVAGVNAIINSIGNYLPVLASMVAGIATSFIVIRYGRRIINSVLKLLTGLF